MLAGMTVVMISQSRVKLEASMIELSQTPAVFVSKRQSH